MCVAALWRQEGEIMKKYCVKCGNLFDATGREVICPECKAHAAEEAKRAAVLRAKRASWTGESVPVRISGRASTVIRRYGAANGMPFTEALDELLKASDYFKGIGQAWQDVEPYKSRRRDKATSTPDTPDTPQDVQTAQDVSQDTPQASKPQGKAQDAQDVPQAAQAAKAASKASASKASKAKTSKASASKATKTATSKSSKE